MSYLDLQDLATVAAQMDLWRAIVRWCSECDTVLDALELAAACLLYTSPSPRDS